MPNLNRLEIIGNVGADPESRFTPEGKMVTNFSVAVNENGSEDVRTEWFNVTCWEKLAEICDKHIYKGMLVWVEGRINLQKWQDHNGVHRSSLALIANRVVFLSRPILEENDEQTDNT